MEGILNIFSHLEEYFPIRIIIEEDEILINYLDSYNFRMLNK